MTQFWIVLITFIIWMNRPPFTVPTCPMSLCAPVSNKIPMSVKLTPYQLLSSLTLTTLRLSVKRMKHSKSSRNTLLRQRYIFTAVLARVASHYGAAHDARVTFLRYDYGPAFLSLPPPPPPSVIWTHMNKPQTASRTFVNIRLYVRKTDTDRCKILTNSTIVRRNAFKIKGVSLKTVQPSTNGTKCLRSVLFMGNLTTLGELFMGNLTTLGELFMGNLTTLGELFMGNLTTLGELFMGNLTTLGELFMGNLTTLGDVLSRYFELHAGMKDLVARCKGREHPGKFHLITWAVFEWWPGVHVISHRWDIAARAAGGRIWVKNKKARSEGTKNYYPRSVSYRSSYLQPTPTYLPPTMILPTYLPTCSYSRLSLALTKAKRSKHWRYHLHF